MISHKNDLDAVCEAARAAGIAALDTEFVWERTYYPILGLVQLGTGRDDNHLIDAPEVRNTSAIASLMADDSVVKILHDAPQDLNIIHRFCQRVPANVFDTRLAASFCGMPGTLSLAALLEALCGVVLEKSETRTNWLRRPLSDAQLDYAVDDVKYLPEMREILLSRLNAQQKSWLDDEHARLCVPENFEETDPALGWKRVKGTRDIPTEHQGVLMALGEWREIEARRSDRPRGFVIHDRDLTKLASLAPKTPETLNDALREMAHGYKRYRVELQECILKGLDYVPPERERSGARIERSRLKTAGDTLRKIADERAVEVGIDPMVLGNRRDLETVYYVAQGAARSECRLLSGWRRELIGDELLEKASAL